MTPTSKSSRASSHRTPVQISEDEDDARDLNYQSKAAVTPTSSTHRYLRSKPQPSAANSSFSTGVISIDSDSDDPGADFPHKHHASYLSQAEKDDDDELPIMAPLADDDPGAKWEKLAEEQRAKEQEEATKHPVEILVTSEIPNTRSGKYKYLLNRSLQLIRDTWAASQKQNGIVFPVPNDEMILTWNKKKVYITSSLSTLGVKPLANGTGFLLNEKSADGLILDKTKIHMEIWTPELYQQMLAQEAERLKAIESGSSDDEGGAPEPEPEEEVQKLRIILRPKEGGDVQCTVRPETTVDTLITFFKAKATVASGKNISLYFDGEMLEEHVTMIDAEIEDGFVIEVHLK